MNPDQPPALEKRKQPWRFSRRAWYSLLAVLLVSGAWQSWRWYDFSRAQRAAQVSPFLKWQYDDPIDAIRADWKAAFSKSTWIDGKRDLIVQGVGGLAQEHRLIETLRPRALCIRNDSEIKTLATLSGLASLQDLVVSECAHLTDLDVLKDASALRSLMIEGCPAVEDFDVLKHLHTLESLTLNSHRSLRNVEWLGGLTALQQLSIAGVGATDLDALKNMRALKKLRIKYSLTLTDLSALNSLPALKSLDLEYCSGLTSLDALTGHPGLTNVAIMNCTNLKNLDTLKTLPALSRVLLLGYRDKDVAKLQAALPRVVFDGFNTIAIVHRPGMAPKILNPTPEN